MNSLTIAGNPSAHSQCYFGSSHCNLLLLRFSNPLQEFLWWLLPVSLWIIFRPPPQIGARVLKRELRCPPKVLVSKLWIRGQVEHISVSSRSYLIGEVS